MDNSKIKILVCYHKPDRLFKDDVLTPIHVGRTLAKRSMPDGDKRLTWLLENLIGDDTGENISEKNSSYNELTAIYWAWKNYEDLGNPEYIGLIHYRRHFIFREMKNIIDVFVNEVDENYQSLINYSYESVEDMISNTDFIFHEGKVDSIKKHYADNHNIKDLHSAISIIDEIHPSYSETAQNYLEQDRGSFCNMFIFPREMFFRYCEWLFKILERYETINDITEKRLFVSERLTGIFIQQEINQGKSYVNLPITLIKEPITIPVAMIWDGDLFSTSVTILSHTFNADQTTRYKFHIIGVLEGHQTDCLMRLSKEHDFDIEIINPKDQFNQNKVISEFNDSALLILHLLLPKVNKCVLLNNKLLATQDESEFYRTCNVDDFWICGVPEGDDDPTSDNRRVLLDFLVLNLKRLRDHKIHEKYNEAITSGMTDIKGIFHKVFGSNIGYFPPWFYNKAVSEFRSCIFDMEEKRNTLQYEARWTSYIYFNEDSPTYSMQGIYSILWWNIAAKVPGYIQKLDFNINRIWDVMVEQQHIINSTFYGSPPTLTDSFNESDCIATTKWIHNHEWSSKIDRWKVVFDNTNIKLNHGHEKGIIGGKPVKMKNPEHICAIGNRVRFLVSYKNKNPIYATGEFISTENILCGAVCLDGSEIVTISVKYHPKDGVLRVYGYDIIGKTDVSEDCKLLKIQVTW